MNAALDSRASLWLRILHFAPTRMALLYVTLTYLYLSGFFFRGPSPTARCRRWPPP